MQFAIILLVILTAACTVGSFVTQGQTYEWYARQYSERSAALIIALHLDDAFHSWWFVLITVFLCLNLLLCNILKLPQLIRKTKKAGDADHYFKMISGLPGDIVSEGDHNTQVYDNNTDRNTDTVKSDDPRIRKRGAAEQVQGSGNLIIRDLKDPLTLFEKLRLPKPESGRTENGAEYLFSQKNRAGLWGAWVCHLGILLLIAGFGFGQMTKKEYTVYGLPGQTKEIGDTGLALTIDDFKVDLRDDDTVSQYTADITVRDVAASGEARSDSARISVNDPSSMFGMKFYQNSTGWAAKVTITKDGKPFQEDVICAGEFVAVQDKPELVIYLNAFYPDYVLDNGTPRTLSSQINNPAYLYTVYYQGSVLGMNALMQDEDLTIDEYVVNFSDPQNYTLIQIKKDPFTPLALAGGLITMLGLILAFYLLPVQICAVREDDGRWTAFGSCRKGGSIFREKFLKATQEAENTAGTRTN